MMTWDKLSEVQPVTSKILMNSLKMNRISHAYLIEGMRGTGKKMLAEHLAMSIFCEEKTSVEPCQSCHNCRRIKSRNHPDIHWLEPEGRSITKGQIDELVREFSHTGFESNRKIYIISNAERFTVSAANRILKFLEEPDVETTEILLTDNLNAVLPTIQSRCQVLSMQPLAPSYLQERLVQLHVSKQRAKFLSALTNNVEDAIELDEQGLVYKMRELAIQLIDTLIKDYEGRFLWMHKSVVPEYKDREEIDLLLNIFLLTLKDISNIQIDDQYEAFVYSNEDRRLELASRHFYPQSLLSMIQAVLKARQRLKQNVHITLVLEDFVLQL